MDFGVKLRQLRDQKGYSQEYVAGRLGISQNTYSKWESGEVRLKAETFPKLAEIFEMELQEIFTHLFSEHFVFNNHNQSGGNAANIIIENASEKLVKSKDVMIEHLKEEVQFLKSLLERA